MHRTPPLVVDYMYTVVFPSPKACSLISCTTCLLLVSRPFHGLDPPPLLPACRMEIDVLVRTTSTYLRNTILTPFHHMPCVLFPRVWSVVSVGLTHAVEATATQKHREVSGVRSDGVGGRLLDDGHRDGVLPQRHGGTAAHRRESCRTAVGEPYGLRFCSAQIIFAVLLSAPMPWHSSKQLF